MAGAIVDLPQHAVFEMRVSCRENGLSCGHSRMAGTDVKLTISSHHEIMSSISLWSCAHLGGSKIRGWLVFRDRRFG